MSPHDQALDRVRGCLLGGAVGDALGRPVEFIYSRREILERYGPRGITDYPDGIGLITDDTQMTIATARGLVGAARSLRAGDYAGVNAAIYREYVAWLKTQDDPAQRRAPGHTCLSALRSGQIGAVVRPLNDSKGCGGVMRVAPVGLALHGRPGEAFTLGQASAAITHGHPGGYGPAGFLAALVARLTEGEDLLQAAAATLDLVSNELDHDTLRLVRAALELAGEGAEPTEALWALGEGWVGDEALAIGLYAALRYPEDFEAAVVAAVNHAGDSDSTGTICGAILGAYLGAAAIPQRWLAGLEHLELLEQMAREFVAAFW